MAQITRADFYSLKDKNSDARYRLLQVLLEKSRKQGKKVHIHCRDAAEAERLDDYIWGFKLESFLPHHILDDRQATIYSPITLGYQERRPNHNEICVNLSLEPISTIGKFERIIEIVIQDAMVLEKTRQHYRAYKEQGFDMHLHNL